MDQTSVPGARLTEPLRQLPDRLAQQIVDLMYTNGVSLVCRDGLPVEPFGYLRSAIASCLWESLN